jgi:hypothetical protein
MASVIDVRISVEHRWNNTETGKPLESEKNVT